jgi:large subunit ribosomal protein L3
MLGLVGIKLGMTQVYDKEGNLIPVTVVECPAATVLSVKTKEGKDGYSAIKLASGAVKERLLSKAEAGVFKKANLAPAKHVAEFRLADTKEYEVGKTLNVSIFEEGKKVTVTGVSKGKGFAGTIKRHKFNRGPETHGSQNVRQPGSIGAHTYPGRTFPGQRMAGHHGDKTTTYKNLVVVGIDAEKNLLFLRGAVPGAKSGKVIVRKQNG